MNVRLLAAMIVICCTACKNSTETETESDSDTNSAATEMPFDKQKWNTKDGYDYPFRPKIVNHLIKKENLAEFKKLKKDELIEMLGQPNRTDSLYLFYTITENRAGIMMLSSKTMVIKMRPDNTIETVRIHE